MDIDWSKAPEGATHYCKMASGFRGHGDSLCSYCISRPPQKAQVVERKVPEYGTLVNPSGKRMEYGADHIGRKVEVLQYIAAEQVYVVRFDWGLGCLDYEMIDFRDDNELLRYELATQLGTLVKMRSTFLEMAEALMAEGWKKEPKP